MIAMGFLEKSRAGVGRMLREGWQPRLLVLSHHYLYSFRTRKTHELFGSLRIKIPLKGMSSVESKLLEKESQYLVEVTSNSQRLLFRTSRKRDHDMWLTLLRGILKAQGEYKPEPDQIEAAEVAAREEAKEEAKAKKKSAKAKVAVAAASAAAGEQRAVSRRANKGKATKLLGRDKAKQLMAAAAAGGGDGGLAGLADPRVGFALLFPLVLLV